MRARSGDSDMLYVVEVYFHRKVTVLLNISWDKERGVTFGMDVVGGMRCRQVSVLLADLRDRPATDM